MTRRTAPEYFGWMAHLVTLDLAASGLRYDAPTARVDPTGPAFYPICVTWITAWPRVLDCLNAAGLNSPSMSILSPGHAGHIPMQQQQAQ